MSSKSLPSYVGMFTLKSNSLLLQHRKMKKLNDVVWSARIGVLYIVDEENTQ